MKSNLFRLALFFLFAINVNAHAQINKQAKIVLNNGTRIKGAIVESFDSNRLKINIYESDTISIRYDHIKKIRFKEYGKINDDFEYKLSNQPSLKTESFFHEIRAGLLIGDENTSGSLQTINGYQFNKYLGTGLGIGVNKYGNYLTLPIYATVKGYLFDKKVSPFYFADIGYGFAWKSNNNEDMFELTDVQGGYYWQLGLGYQVNFYNSSLVFTLGYINQDSKADYIYYRPWDVDNVEVSERRILRRFSLTVGFSF